jgi:hypothetical protein
MIAEFDVDGVFLASVLVTALIALAVTALVHRLLILTRLYRFIWRPALFEAALFLIVWAGAALWRGPLPHLP